MRRRRKSRKSMYTCMLYDSFLDLKEYVRCHHDEIDKFIDDNEEINPLIFAIRNNLTKAALYLIEKGANVNLTDKYNMSTLMFAVRANSFELCKKLLDANKELVNIELKDGHTAVWYAILAIGGKPSGSIDFRIFDLLIENSANIYKPISNKVTPLKLITNQKNADDILTHIRTQFPQLLKLKNT